MSLVPRQTINACSEGTDVYQLRHLSQAQPPCFGQQAGQEKLLKFFEVSGEEASREALKADLVDPMR